MSPHGSSELRPPPRRCDYAGFRAVIKAVGTGPRGSRALTFDEARDATRGPARRRGHARSQAGAFLIAMRIKGETPDELAGIAQALRDAARAVAPDPPAGSAADRRLRGRLRRDAPRRRTCRSPPRCSPPRPARASSCTAAARLGPQARHDAGRRARRARRPGRARSRAESLAMLERAGVALVHAGAAIPGWDALAAMRDEIGLRGPLHSAEKLVDSLGATRFVVGHTHSSYRDRILGALTLLGARARGRGARHGGLRRRCAPAGPSASDAGGALDLPETPGSGRCAATATRRSPPTLTRAIAGGDEHGGAAHTAMLSAGVRLYAAGALRRASPPAPRWRPPPIADGRAAATLEALLAG